jgi:hypothetical protein
VQAIKASKVLADLSLPEVEKDKRGKISKTYNFGKLLVTVMP